MRRQLEAMSEEKRIRIVEELPSRLAENEYFERLTKILTNFDFLQIKLSLLGLEALINDYEPTSSDSLKSIQGAMILANLAVKRDITQFASQLMGRLDGTHPDVVHLRNQIVQQMEIPWLCPLQPSLGTANTILKQTLLSDADRSVRSIAMTDDGRYLASGGSDKTVSVWALSAGRATPLFNLTSEMDLITDVIFTHQGDDLLAACDDGTIWVWDWKNKVVKTIIKTPFVPINALLISPDDQFVFAASGSIDNSAPNVVAQWDFSKRELVRTFTGHRERVNDLVLLDNTLFSASDDGSIRHWGIETAHELFRYEPQPGSLQGGHFSRILITPDGAHFVTTSHDRSVWVCDIETGKAVNEFTGHGTPCTAIACAYEGHIFATGSNDGMIQIWDLEQDVPPLQLLEHTDEISDLLFSADDRTLISSSHDGKIIVWDLGKRGMVEQRGHRDRVNTVAISPDSQFAATGAGVNYIANDISVKIWDVATRQAIQALNVHQDYIHRVQFTSDSRTLISAADDGMVVVWSLEEQRVVQKYAPYTVFCTSPDEKYIACWGKAKSIDVFALGTQEKKAQYPNQLGVFTFTADGRAIISRAKDSAIQMREIETGQTILEFERFSHEGIVWAFQATHDYLIGTFVFGESNAQGRIRYRYTVNTDHESIAVWNIKTGDLLYTLKGMRGDLFLPLSAEAQSLFCVDITNRIHQFELSTGTLLKSWAGHESYIEALSAVMPHGYFVSVDEGGVLRSWHEDVETPVASFYADARLTTCQMTDDIIIAGEETGRVHFLKLKHRLI